MKVEELFATPTIRLVGNVDAGMVTAFDTACIELFRKKPHPTNVLLTLTTGGGLVSFTYGMIERLHVLQEVVPVTFLGLGVVMSSGVDIMLAVPKERRVTTAHTRFLIHTVQHTGTLAMSNTVEAKRLQLREMLQDLKEQRRFFRQIARAVAADTGLSVKQVQKRAQHGWYFSGKKALKLGLVHSLLQG